MHTPVYKRSPLHAVNGYAARTELKKLLTSTFSRLLSEDSDCAADSTWWAQSRL